MDESLPTVAWAQYHEEGTNSGAVAAQFDVIGAQLPDKALEWGEMACKAVPFPCCSQASCPPVLSGIGDLAQRKSEAKVHLGLGGVHHAAFITGVSFADVQARGNGIATTKEFRNQACNDASMALSCKGAGVQL